MISRPTHKTPLIILLALALFAGLAQAKNFRYVIIDAGHGGHDKGGLSGKVYEKHLALDTALRLEYWLKQRGIRTKMTRRSDVFISLPGRASFGNKYRNSIFVSIHYNHASKTSPHGLETFYYGAEGKKLATHVQSKMMSKIATINRGVKYARFYVLRHSKNPAILVEGGFVSNSSERNRMKKGWFRQSIAEGIGEGILSYKRSR
ncbi:N-acetylmuramoyl-L-alanine amidase [Verrucomicrobiaceae bacterium R5-34]|uniref:N-acetylmuramoyl-L-alanine amidase n=1 Tax=Oceaniferula flava TaxID=2800421 RepID=A0AAE2SDK7_9BACT|nr:N-acetylmuramoyl-L-alanine amidase [Oceaniferula flavus]MBK1831288.1 N-acetylmuramoyl-L-alanine amidase [Verrucomicrobiaceae bacterium R5-34]MBK1855457.1 N-acetylmuramoyl-L-alanine amidase [Oceaniferula flavus]MBM1136763.1 N-acetylmuramoyl-L-alanine amidase [Oceaniferula flavus]